MNNLVKAIGLVATSIGVVTGLGTIVGWLVSDETPGVVARIAVGTAGMVYVGGFVLLCLGVALLPPRRLRRFLERDESQEHLPRPLRRPVVARLTYLALACGGVLVAVDTGPDPKAGFWVVLGAVALALVLFAWLAVRRQAAARRKSELQECPDCAEMVKTKARVCRYCGYRFKPPPPAFDEALNEVADYESA
jgi:hypothetical protein